LASQPKTVPATLTSQPNPAAQPGLAQALNDHDRMKRSTDITLFYARREKDTVLPRILIDRIEDAAEIATTNTPAYYKNS